MGKYDKETTDKELVEMLEDIKTCLPVSVDMALHEYRRDMRVVFLYVSSNFDDEVRLAVQMELRDRLHKRTVVSRIIDDSKFQPNDVEELESWIDNAWKGWDG